MICITSLKLAIHLAICFASENLIHISLKFPEVNKKPSYHDKTFYYGNFFFRNLL